MSGGINTTRNGATIGVEGERKMADEHGNYGFRTEMRNNPDGSVTTLRTRDGWNEFTTSQANVLADKYPRGFGMAPVTATASTLFVPDDWRTLTKNYTPRMPTFFVMPKPTSVGFNPKENHKWYDVLSWQGAEVRVNGLIANPLESNCSLPAACIPYCLPANVSANDATYYGKNLTFFISKVAVYSLVDGVATRTALHPETPMWEGRAYLGGQLITDNKAILRQLFWSGDFVSGFWSALSATFDMAPGSVSISGLQMQPLEFNPVAVDLFNGTSTVSNTHETYPLPVTLIGFRTTPTIVSQAQDDRTGATIVVQIHYVSSDGIVTVGTDSYCSWDNYDTSYTADLATTLTVAGKGFGYIAKAKKIRGHHYGYVYRDDMEVPAEDQYNWGWTQSAYYTGYGWRSSDGFESLPHNYYVGTIHFLSGEVDHNLRQNYESAEYTGEAAVTLSPGKPLIQVSFRRYEEYRRKTSATPLSFVNGTVGEVVARGTVEVEVPVVMGTPQPEWWAERDSIVTSNAGNIGGGVAAYMNLNVIHHNGQGQLMPYTIHASERGLSDSSISFSTVDHFVFDEANEVYGEIRGVFSGKEVDNVVDTLLEVMLKFTTPGGSYEKTLFSGPLPMSNLLPFIGDYDAEYQIPTPLVRCLFAPKVMTQGCFHGITYTTTDEINGGAAPHFFANFTLSLCDHLGGTETDESSGTGTDLVVMPGHLLEMLYCYIYSNSYGQDPDYVYPVTRVATYNHLQKYLFEKSWVVHLHNSDKGTWTGNVDLAAFDTPSTGIFRT